MVTISFTSSNDLSNNFITVTQAVNLDTMESDIVTNNGKITNATHTGDVTGATALTIGAKKVQLSMMEDGVDGELITYDASGVAAKVSVGTAAQVLTSNGVGAAPTFQDAGGGGTTILTVAKPSDEARTNSSVLLNDTDLHVEMEALGEYQFILTLNWENNPLNDIVKFDFDGGFGYYIARTKGVYVDGSSSIGFDGTTDLDNSGQITVIHGYVENITGSPVEFNFRWAQNVASGAKAITLKVRSSLVLIKLN